MKEFISIFRVYRRAGNGIFESVHLALVTLRKTK